MSEMSAESTSYDAEMSFEDAEAALSGAMAQDRGEASPDPVAPPVEQVAPDSDSQGETVEAEGTTEPVAEEAAEPSDTFAEKFDPNALPPELMPGYKLMQAEFTRKMQQLAEERKQFEPLAELGDPEELQAARELYTSLQDPSTWPELHAALTAQMEAHGLTPAEAAAAATEAIQEEAQAPAPSGVPAALEALVKEDPELAPLAQLVTGLQAELQQLKQGQAAREQAEREEQINNAMLAEVNRQEAVLRSANKDYDDRDIQVIAKHSAYHDGNLIDAQKELEEYVSYRLARALSLKESVPMVPPAPAAPAPAESEETSSDDIFNDPMDEATRLALHDLQSQAGMENAL